MTDPTISGMMTTLRRGLDAGRFLSRLSGQRLLGFSQSLEKIFLASLDSAVKMATGVTSEQLDQVLRLDGEQLVKVNTPVGVLPEGALLLDLNARVRHWSLLSGQSLLDNRNRTQKWDESHVLCVD